MNEPRLPTSNERANPRLDIAWKTFLLNRGAMSESYYEVARIAFVAAWHAGFSERTPSAPETSDSERMRNTLTKAGYTDCGGEFWKPPLGPRPAFLDANVRLRALIQDAVTNMGAWEYDDLRNWQQRAQAEIGSPEETSTDGWRCVTCGHENPKGVLRCQNSKCTALSYSAENGLANEDKA